MKFKHGTRRRALEYEKDWVARWKADRTFEKSIEQRSKDNSYVFYDGPPFISGVPHHGTLLSSIVKDAVPRYQTMKGKRVERVWGWDAHGLPAERYTEKKLNIHSRQEVLDYGIEKYILATRENMLETSSAWENVIDRIGRWVDFKGAYKTMDKEYMESIWWAFKELYEKKKIYEGEKVLMYCTLDGTPLSKAEVTMDAGAYQDVTDPSVYVKFKLENGKHLLAWTTTPWTLPANTALAINKDVDYVEVETLTTPKRVFLISGKHAVASDEYFPSLRKQLENDGHDVTIIDHENCSSPNLAKNLAKLSSYDFTDAHIITHSLGAATFLKLLNDTSVNVASLTMIAPSYPGASVGSDREWQKNSGYVGYEVDFDKIRKQISSRPTIIHSDDTVIRNENFQQLADNLVAELVYEVGKGHFFEKESVNRPGYDFRFTEKFIVARELVEKVFVDEKHQPLVYEIVRELKGEELVGLSYEPLFGVDRGKNAHKVWHADYVETEAGTGIVHLAPTYGEEDFMLAKQEGFPAVHVIDQNGYYTEGDWKGKNVWEINKQIAKDLKERGVVWKIDYIRHSYPHCHRCGTKLMYRAHPSWFMDIDGQRETMLEKNKPINWFPGHVKNGRFQKTVETAPDWNISRDRFWATAMPVWKTESGKVKVVGSYAELKELSGVELEDYHRPWIDEVTFTIDGEEYTRIDKVMDSWFEAGSMPFAQFHYPFENKEKFEANFPGDFIVEYIGQVRAWFYYMHAMNVALFGENSFKNVIVTGNVAGNDGRKMSKSYGNYTDPNELMDKFSADSLRFLLLSSPLLNGEDFALQDKEVGDVARKLSMIWNMYDFFTMYAEVDDFTFPYDTSSSDAFLVRGMRNTARSDTPDSSSRTGTEKSFMIDVDVAKLRNPLDIWIVSRVHQLASEVEKNMDAYNIPDALTPILPFLDDASNWYVRRSRRRFWKSEDDGDKADAYKTLHYVLVRLSYALAPFTPFLAEELYRNLTGDEESIHLKDWLPAGAVNQAVVDEMNTVRDYVNEGLSLRAKNGIKVRQPLKSVTVPTCADYVDQDAILKEELNVKQVVTSAEHGREVLLDTDITPKLKREGLMREVVRHVQSARKKAGLNIDDRIVLSLESAVDELAQAINEYQATIAQETLSNEIVKNLADGQAETVTIEGSAVRIILKKAE